MKASVGHHLAHLTPEQLQELQGTAGRFTELWDRPLQISPNPMTAVFGYAEGVAVVNDDTARPHPLYEGPECGGCIFFLRGVTRPRFHKCAKRGITHGAGTDHRVHWPACGLYKAKDEPPT